MLTLILGGCGTGKSTKLMEQMQTELAEGKKVLVLVPEQFSFEAEKKLYDFLGAGQFNQLETYSFGTLSRHILGLYGNAARAQRYASDQEKLIFLYQALQSVRGDLTFLNKRSNSAETVLSLLSLFSKIRKAGVSAEQLLDTSDVLGDRLGEKTRDIGKILFAYDHILSENGLYDSLTDLTEAAMIANIQNFFFDRQVYIDEFDSFTGDQYRMLDVVLAQSPHVYAAIRTDEPEAAYSVIFQGGNRTYRLLTRMAKEDYHIPVETRFCREYRRSVHGDIAAVSTQLFRQQQHKAEYSGHIHITEAADPLEEAEYIGATICRMLSSQPTLRCSDIAIAVREESGYAALIERALLRYGLPCTASAAKPVLHTELIRYFLSLLELLITDELRTQEALRYLKSPLSGYDAVAVSMLEHYCFTWSIDREDWLQLFYAQDDELAGRAEPFGGEQLEKTRKAFVLEVQTLRRRCTGKSVREICTVLYRHLCEKKKLRDGEGGEADPLQEREFITLWNLLADMMDTLVVCFGSSCLELPALYELFLLLLQNTSISTPPQTLDCIQLVEAQTARLNAPAVVFVPAVLENEFPGEIRLSGIFTQQELELLGEQGIEISRMYSELYSDERLIVEKLLSAPSEQLYLSYPRISTAQESVKPSMIISEILRMFPENAPVFLNTSSLPLTYFIWTKQSAYFHFVRRLHEDSGAVSALQQLLGEDSVYAARIQRLTAMQQPADTVSPEIMQQYLGTQLRLSPSGIESFYQCPFSYFCQHCLHLYVPEKQVLSSLNLGNFAHYCLEQILRKYDVQHFAALTPAQLMEEIHSLSDVFSRENFSDAVRRDGRFQLNYRMSGGGLLKVLQQMQQELSNGEFVPVGFEVPVTERSDSNGIPPLVLRDGEILCHGKIDRIDCCDTGEKKLVRVVDYKTGNKIFSPDKLAAGLDMQMLIYLFALRRGGRYAGAESGGVLYMPSGQLNQRNYCDRSPASAEAAEILEDFYRMKGMLLDRAAAHMEPKLAAAAEPVLSADPDSELYLVNDTQMQQIEQLVEQKICDMADSLYAGHVAPKPYLRQDKPPCAYCDYTDICGRSVEDKINYTKAERKEAIAGIFGGQDSQDEEEKK